MAKTLTAPWASNEGRLKIGQVLTRLAQSPLVWGFLGFLLGRAAIFGEIWPFGLAYAAAFRALNRNKQVLPVLGVVLGITSSVGFTLSLPYYASIAILVLAPGEGERLRKRWLIFAVFGVKMVLHYLLQPIPMVAIVAITECTFAVFAYGFFHSMLHRFLGQQLAWAEFYVFFLALTFVVSLDWSWGGYSPRLFLVCALIALGARVGGLGVSSLLGPALALLTLLLGGEAQIALFIVISSLLTGFLHRFGWGYYVGPILALVFSLPGPADGVTIQLISLVFAAVWLARLVPEDRLRLLARTIPGTDSFQQQDRAHEDHLKIVFDQKIDGHLTVLEELENTLMDNENPLFHRQMQGMAELLKRMKTSFSPEMSFARDLEEMLLSKLAHMKLSHITVLPSLDGFEIHGALQGRCPNLGMCREIADYATGTIASQRYGVSFRNCTSGGGCGFRISPCPNYKVEIGRATLASEGVSGDNAITFEIAASKIAIVLSDGMGVGRKAHTESDIALRLLERMIKAGYDLATSVSIINHLLILRNQDDMFVTIDMVVVDLFSGQLEFVKVGSAPSFIKHGREVEIIHNRTLPVGVLSEVDIESDRRMLQEGEVLIMATDGVLDVQRTVAWKDEWMCWKLRRLPLVTDMAAMAEMILSDCLSAAHGRVDDDMMVVVARLLRADWNLESYRRVD